MEVLNTKFVNDLKILTDGSVGEKGVGAGIVIPDLGNVISTGGLLIGTTELNMLVRGGGGPRLTRFSNSVKWPGILADQMTE
ncbi:hypothetical protein BaRGS_00023925 [Batillaria attramentaria]|uniref:Uncharacterized protein n=1 Tax=Batillaria attramentaria TaxID=370345 RepID=A0ABD0KD77_9CAEN